MSKLIWLLIFTAQFICAQESEVILFTDSGRIKGTLKVPTNVSGRIPVVLIIAGSGPTDRDGNNRRIENNCLKQIADTLFSHGIASLRYDKRGVGQSDRGTMSERQITLEHFIRDAEGWVDQLADDSRFNRIFIAGHSEGSLIGIVAAQHRKSVNGLVSISGAGRRLDDLLKEQLSNMAPEPRKVVYELIDKIKAGDTIGNIPPLLYGLFRPSVQPFLTTMFRYDPASEMSRLTIPSLVVQGNTDLQTSVEDAHLLAGANPKAKLVIIENMNHVLKDCDHRDKAKQLSVYDDPNLPLNASFCRQLTNFIKNTY